MIKQQQIKKRYLLFLTLFLILTNFISLKTLKKVEVKDIKIYGSKIFSRKDIIRNSSLSLPTRLIFIRTKFIEKELKLNLSLENVLVSRQVFPFGLKILIKTRRPIAYGERFLNGKKIIGFIDKNGFFINQEYAERNDLTNPTLKVLGWQENFRKTLSTILTYQKNGEFELVKINFSQNGFLTLEEKDLKTIALGFNQNLIKTQLQIIGQLKEQFNKNNFAGEIDNIDLIDPNYPKIKVFKP